MTIRLDRAWFFVSSEYDRLQRALRALANYPQCQAWTSTSARVAIESGTTLADITRMRQEAERKLAPSDQSPEEQCRGRTLTSPWADDTGRPWDPRRPNQAIRIRDQIDHELHIRMVLRKHSQGSFTVPWDGRTLTGELPLGEEWEHGEDGWVLWSIQSIDQDGVRVVCRRLPPLAVVTEALLDAETAGMEG